MRVFVPKFLTVDEVVEIHRLAIEAAGGSFGIRDAGLLDAAVHAPQLSYGGEFLFDMAAVYLLHIAANHAFVDGNKRTAWVSARTFLDWNGYRVKPRRKDVVQRVESIGSGGLRDWGAISEWLAGHATRRVG